MFDAEKVKKDCVEWIRDWFNANGPDCNAVIGISGGKDSTIVAGLCVEALGKDRVIGVMMPNGHQEDFLDAAEVIEALDIRPYCVNIQDAVESILGRIHTPVITDQTKINLPPRIRMATLYAISQSVNGRVANTCNLSEDYVGYSTRWGDSVGDFAPLANLTSDEVIAIGDTMENLPQRLVHKTPSDGLCGKTDEDNFGFTYAELNKYIRTGEWEDYSVKEKIDRLHERNQFKMRPIPVFEYNQEG